MMILYDLIIEMGWFDSVIIWREDISVLCFWNLWNDLIFLTKWDIEIDRFWHKQAQKFHYGQIGYLHALFYVNNF